MIKAIIFDFAGVIGTDGYWIWLREKVKDIENQEEFFHKLGNQVDKGIISHEQFVNQLAEKSGVSKELIWPQVFERIVINFDLLGLIKELKKNYKIGLLTNFTYPWMEKLFEKYKLVQYFDEVLISSAYKVIKPEPEAFAKVLELLEVSKEEAVFIDDRQMHVDGAENFGIKAFLFTSNEQLKKDLQEIGI